MTPGPEPMPYRRGADGTWRSPAREVAGRRRWPAAPDRELVEAGALGVLAGWLLGRRHHPLLWAALGLGALLAVDALAQLWPWALAAAAVLLALRLHSRGWSARRIGASGAATGAGVLLVGLVAVTVGAGPALLVAALALAGWRLGLRPRLADWMAA